jgi:hypothetical protein
MDKRPPALLPPKQGPQPAALPHGPGKRGAGRHRQAYARAYAAGVLQRMADILHPAGRPNKKG